MPHFTTEADVREKFQLDEAPILPASLVNRSIADAHAQILRRLDPDYDTEPPHPELALAETMLAGAHLLRSLTVGAARRRKRITVGGNAIAPADRDTVLKGLADATESQAWDLLEPFLIMRPPRRVAEITASLSVFGEDAS